MGKVEKGEKMEGEGDGSGRLREERKKIDAEDRERWKGGWTGYCKVRLDHRREIGNGTE